ncbi:MAG: NAD(P)H-dependent oxidoreductase [Actinobacteria bacterium]|mgnify:CR=1 FL=1|nr:NAD(P)H-dependent oxidoreductase [Actinomycetota bacterium]
MSKSATHILGIAGSLRAGSFNLGLLRAAAELAPEGVGLEIVTLHDIPPYNADVQSLGDPGVVLDLKQHVAEADAVLIASPEYNYSIPGVLKNAIDWVSRPPKLSPLRKKPVGIMGASGGESGTMRGQLALRQVFVFLDSYVMAQPELRVTKAAERFDSEGALTDEELRERLRAYLAALVEWARLVG